MIELKKILISTLFIALFAGVANLNHSYAQQVRSDYEIQQSFRSTYQALNDSLTVADTSVVVDSLVTQIRQLEENYDDHSELLNMVLYPETFDEKVTRLKRNAISTRDKLIVIERQEAKLQDLGSTLTSYDNRLSDLDKTTDSLRKVINKKEQSEAQLTRTVRQYRRQLQQRDDLILSFVDSVIVSYELMDFESIKDLETVKKRARFNADGNALKMIRNIISDHRALLDSESQLTTEEYLRMNAVQHDFQIMWDKVGDKIVQIYGDNDTKKEEIDREISQWETKIDTVTWNSLDRSFGQAGISLPQFNSRATFYNTLRSYIEESINSKGAESTNDNYEDYKNFHSFWVDPVKSEWLTHISKAEILDGSQVASIDMLLAEWETEAEKESNLLIYLLGLSVLVIIVLGVVMARQTMGTSEENPVKSDKSSS